MYTIHHFDGHPKAQAVALIDDDGSIALRSYSTIVAIIDADGFLTVTGLYSRTTIKHIGWFMREFVKYPNGERGTYQDAKNAYKGGYRFNIYTGEIVDWE